MFVSSQAWLVWDWASRRIWAEMCFSRYNMTVIQGSFSCFSVKGWSDVSAVLSYPKGQCFSESLYAYHKWKAAVFQAAVSNQTTLNVTTPTEKTFDLPFAQGHLEETPDVMKGASGPFISKAQNKMLVDCSQKYMSVRKTFLSLVFLWSTQANVSKSSSKKILSKQDIHPLTSWTEGIKGKSPQALQNVKPTDFPQFC